MIKDSYPLTLIPEKEYDYKINFEIQKAKEEGKIKDKDKFYYSKEFGLVKILIPTPKYNSVTLKPLNLPIDNLNLNVINSDLLRDEKKYPYVLHNMKNIAEKMENIKDINSAYVSTDDLPGFKIIANSREVTKYEGDLVYVDVYGIMFIQVLDIHASNYEDYEP